MPTLLVICLIALLSACDIKPKQVDTPKIDENDICGQYPWKTTGYRLKGMKAWDDFRARLGATREMDYSKRMDIALEYGFRASEYAHIEKYIKIHGVYGAPMIEIAVRNDVCKKR